MTSGMKKWHLATIRCLGKREVHLNPSTKVIVGAVKDFAQLEDQKAKAVGEILEVNTEIGT